MSILRLFTLASFLIIVAFSLKSIQHEGSASLKCKNPIGYVAQDGLWYVELQVKTPAFTQHIRFLVDTGSPRDVSFSRSTMYAWNIKGVSAGSNIQMGGQNFKVIQSAGKYESYDLIGMSFLQATKTSISKEPGNKKQFHFKYNCDENKVGNVVHETSITPGTILQLVKVDVKFSNSKQTYYVPDLHHNLVHQGSSTVTKNIIFDTGANLDKSFSEPGMFLPSAPKEKYAIMQFKGANSFVNCLATKSGAVPQQLITPRALEQFGVIINSMKNKFWVYN